MAIGDLLTRMQQVNSLFSKDHPGASRSALRFEDQPHLVSVRRTTRPSARAILRSDHRIDGHWKRRNLLPIVGFSNRRPFPTPGALI
jgi:hypothetical protein